MKVTVSKETMIPDSNAVNHRARRGEVVLQGVSICPGIGFGLAYVVDPVLSVVPTRLAPQQVRAEEERYTAAVNATRHHLCDHVATVHGDEPPEIQAILNVHEAILNDELFHDKVRKRIAAELKNAEWCLWHEATNLISRFSSMRDPYFAARGEDIRDMAHNLIGVLSGGKSKANQQIEKGRVFTSHHLHSSDAMLAHRFKSTGFVSESRALVSHAAILLKGFGIPSVGVIKGLTDCVQEGDRFIVDGMKGVVIVRPSSATLEKYRAQKETAEHLEPTGVVGCMTADGTKIVLKANIENPDQVGPVLVHGLDGIGLFRTEFLISAEAHVPTEEEQYTMYRHVIEKADGVPVVIRTFDIGGDKSMGLSDRCSGRNPSLGLRGIRRHLMDQPEELRTQLRAILRAALGADVGILIPMVTTLADVTAAKGHLADVRKELLRAGVPFSREVDFGAMIETPAAAATVHDILGEVDFLSVGTNDLLQYFNAADRDNERVIQYNDASSPAFLWLMEHIITQARNIGREADVTVCGEVATDTRVLPHLLRLGYRSFSVSPASTAIMRGVCSEFTMGSVSRDRHS